MRFEQVQAAVAAVAASGQMLHHRLSALDAWTGEAPALDAAEGEALMTDCAAGLGTELEQCRPALDTLQNALSGLSATIRALQQSGSNGSARWTADQAAMADTCGAFDAACTASAQSVSQQMQALSNAAQQLAPQFSDAEGATQQAFQTMTTALAQPWSQALSEQFKGLAAELRQQHAAQMASRFDATHQGFEQVLAALESSMGEQSGQFQTALLAELQGIGTHVGVEMHARLQGTIQSLLDDALQRITESTEQSILQSGIGVQTSATLAPLVPQLVAIRWVVSRLHPV